MKMKKKPIANVKLRHLRLKHCIYLCKRPPSENYFLNVNANTLGVKYEKFNTKVDYLIAQDIKNL